jgi:hypothetical protein
MLEVVLVDQGRRGWAWEVRDQSGTALMKGKTKARQEAKYQRDRALFQLLATGWKPSSHKPPRDGISDRVR